MAIVTSTTLPPEIQVQCADALLSVNTPGLIMNIAAMQTELSAKNGNTIRYSRYDRLATAPVPLGPSGATPPSTNVNRVDLDATVSYYGQYIAVNQQVTLTNQDNVLMEFAELLGLSLRMTEDQLTKNMLEASASVYRCTGGSNGDLPTNLSLPDIQDVTSTLMSDNAWMMFSKQGGEDKFGTGPVRNAYLALGHTDLSKDLDNLNDFLPKWNYPRDNGAVNISADLKSFLIDLEAEVVIN